MPTYYKSTSMNPGAGIRKGYRHGGRNLRAEEARVIGVQDNAADELRRVRRRRPKDAREVRDRRAQLGRVGSRERNARDEMRRLRGEARRFQYGGGIGRQMGGIDSLPRPLGLSSMMQPPQRLSGGTLAAGPGVFPATKGVVTGPAQPVGGGRYRDPYGGGFSRIPVGAEPQGAVFRQPQPGEAPRTLQPLPAIGPQQFRPPRPSSSPAQVAQQIAASEAASRRRFPQSQISTMPSAAGIQRGAGPRPWFPSTQRPEYLPETQAQFVPWARGGRVGLKKGGRIPRKKGVKFI
jgi:hypothetical protein